MNIYYLDVQEVARLLRTSKRNVQMYCKKGLLNGARREGRKWVVPHISIEGFTPAKSGRPRKSREDS